jgi:uncharacterized protein (TIGR02452 family)
LFCSQSGGNVGCLAYASAKNPGGGFLSGSGGQEESIARSSGYYLCAAKSSAIYEYNRVNKDPFHSEHVIVSTNVPVIRDEAVRTFTYHSCNFCLYIIF